MLTRDEKGRFWLHSTNGECEGLEREEARKHLHHHKQTSSKKDDQYTYPSIGEQWISHREYFERGKAFIQIGRNELSRDWECVFRMTKLRSLAPISYIFLHGIELGLKAFMVYFDKRVLPIDLKDAYGHNIKKLLEVAVATKHGLEMERPIVMPVAGDGTTADGPGGTVGERWVEGIFGKVSREEERQFDNAIGISFERYAQKGTEYPISVFENYEDAHLASVAGLAYTLYEKIRDKDNFFEQRQRRQHMEFETWLEELHSERQKYHLTVEEAAEQIGRSLAIENE